MFFILQFGRSGGYSVDFSSYKTLLKGLFAWCWLVIWSTRKKSGGCLSWEAPTHYQSTARGKVEEKYTHPLWTNTVDWIWEILLAINLFCSHPYDHSTAGGRSGIRGSTILLYTSYSRHLIFLTNIWVGKTTAAVTSLMGKVERFNIYSNIKFSFRTFAPRFNLECVNEVEWVVGWECDRAEELPRILSHSLSDSPTRLFFPPTIVTNFA